MSEPRTYSWMTKDVLMKYILVALCVLVAISFLSWGITSIILCVISVLTAVTLDYLLSLVMKGKGPSNTISASVFGLIVALSYSLGTPSSLFREVFPLTAPWAYVYVVLISVVGMVFFEKLQTLSGRKYVNSVAATKLLVFLPLLYQVFLPSEHLAPSLTAPISFSGSLSFGSYLQAFVSNGPLVITNAQNLLYNMVLLKFHDWVGGASSIAVIVVGITLFTLCRKYVKWRITSAYFVAIIAMSLLMSAIYGGDVALRLIFELFIGSSIFLAFFMATDSATTPLTYMGQMIFGVGLGILTVIIQTYTGFFGGSILSLVIMNFTSPFLDKVGTLHPLTRETKIKLPEAKEFRSVKVTECIRCGVCMRSCCHQLSPILIKQQLDKGDLNAAKKLQPNLCDSCGNCNFVCPARIDLKSAVLKTKAALRAKL